MKIISIFLFLLFFLSPIFGQDKIVVGSKHFNEGYILSEIVAQILEAEGFQVERKFNLGGTSVAFEALKNGEIDVYPEYTGTISAEILKEKRSLTFDEINRQIQEKFSLQISAPYGFNNTYAIVLNETLAAKFNLEKISDLTGQTNLKGAVSYEFLKRADGWESLANAYNLQQKVQGIEHGLAYNALKNGSIDFTDAYSTDGEIKQLGFKLLIDDRKFFPDYAAVSFYRSNLPEKAKQALNRLENRISETEMQEMNASALFEKKDFSTIANDFLIRKNLVNNNRTIEKNEIADLFRHILRHLFLTFLSVLIAVSVAVPLGILLYRFQFFLNPILYLIGIMQTIPSIALLALMIPFLGIGTLPAVVALFLYALLPILRNTIAGLKGVDPQLKNVATAIGLNSNQRLKYIELPLALPLIIAGIRVASVINVGTATLAAFIGAGGLGEYIVTGLALNNQNLILKGAIPAALLAILIELLFDFFEKRFGFQNLK